MSQNTQDIQTINPTITPIDPRSVCNLLLDEAECNQSLLSNIVLQKLLYFSHAIHLVEVRQPLVSGYFEAWQYGPVHPGAFHAFKKAGAEVIRFRAEREDPLTGRKEAIPNPTNPSVVRLVRRVVIALGHLSLSKILNIAHAPEAPWHFVVDKARTSMAFGMRIPDEVILDRFRHHKVSIGSDTIVNGEIGENAPFA